MRRHWCPTKQIAEESKALHALSRRTYYDIFDGILTLGVILKFFFRVTAAVCSSAFSSAAKEWFHRIYIYNKAPLARWHGHVMPVLNGVLLCMRGTKCPSFRLRLLNQPIEPGMIGCILVDVAKKCYPRWPKKAWSPVTWIDHSLLGQCLVFSHVVFLFFRHTYSCGFSEGPEKTMNHKDVTLKQGNWKTRGLDIHIIHPCCLNSPLLLQMPQFDRDHND